MLALASPVLATSLGPYRDAKEVKPAAGYQPAVDGREGGETVETAFPIPALPFTDTGATCDNIHDYDEGCPYFGSNSPDVVYGYTPDHDTSIDIDLCGSQYDTKVFVYVNEVTWGAPYACNDDFYVPGDPCGAWVSKLEFLPVFAGNTYYIVVDGYGSHCGEYLLNVIFSPIPCVVECPPGALLEGEPPLVDDYEDFWNSGCGGYPIYPFQPIWGQGNNSATMCAVSGWYDYYGDDYRDTDWFEVVAAGAQVDWTIFAEHPVLQFVILPDCNLMELVFTEEVDRCTHNTIQIPATTGQLFWLWVAPQDFIGPVNEFDYLMDLSGIRDDPVPIEPVTWGAVKAMYR